MKKQLVTSLEYLKMILKDGDVQNFFLSGDKIQISRVLGTPKPWYINYLSIDTEEFLSDKDFKDTDIYIGISKQNLLVEVDD